MSEMIEQEPDVQVNDAVINAQIDDTQHDEPIESQESEQDAESPEEQARKMGWSDMDSYRGDPDLWKPAEEFLKDAEEDFPRTRDVNKWLIRQIDRQKKSMDSLVAHQERETKIREEEAYKRGIAEVEERMREATMDGDYDAVQDAVKQRDALQKGQSQQSDEVVLHAWKANNTWFDTDPIMRSVAIVKETELFQQGVPLADRLKQVDNFVREQFSDKFGNTSRKTAKQAPIAINARGNNTTKAPPRFGTYEALKPEHRAECDRVVKEQVARGHKAEDVRKTWLQYTPNEPDFYVSYARKQN
jgi:hypothetical protein